MSNGFKRLFYDIETSPNEGYFWKIGKVYLSAGNIKRERQIICISWAWEDQNKVHRVDWGDDACDKKILETFLPVLEKADEIVAHYGTGFDIKWIRGRAFFWGMPMNHTIR